LLLGHSNVEGLIESDLMKQIFIDSFFEKNSY